MSMNFNYTDDELLVLRIADEVMWTHGEKMELLHFLGYPETIPNNRGLRVQMVMEKIMEARFLPLLDLAKSLRAPVVEGDVAAGYDDGYYTGLETARESAAESIMNLLPKAGA